MADLPPDLAALVERAADRARVEHNLYLRHVAEMCETTADAPTVGEDEALVNSLRFAALRLRRIAHRHGHPEDPDA